MTLLVQLAGSRSAPQKLTFGVNASSQDAFCGHEIMLSVVPLDCSSDSGSLPGCHESKTAKGLELSDGECDPFYLYWDHQAKQISWWRN